MGIQLPAKRGTAPSFRPVSIVAKRSPISGTAEQLFSIYYIAIVIITKAVKRYTGSKFVTIIRIERVSFFYNTTIIV